MEPRQALGRRALALAFGGLALAAGGAARAEKDADALRISWRDAIPDIDPYRNQLRTGFVLAHQVWDCLIDRDPATFELRPLLATGWRLVDDVTLEFRLREDVTFHDGSPFGADDVAYTVGRVLGEGDTAVPELFTWLAGAEVVDAGHVRLILRQPFPAALEYVAMALPILPRQYRERIGAAAFSRAPVGTGPYRVTQMDAARAIRLERFDGSPKGKPAIGRISITAVADDAAAFADLLADRADWIWQIGPDMFAAAAHEPGLQALRVGSMRVGYLAFDAAGRSLPGGPLTQVKVRQAICCAIDRAAIVRRLAGVATRVLETPCYPTQFGCDAAASVRYPFDPEQARALLAEAGYAGGFATELVSYVLPEDGQAVAGALQAVGIDARLRQLPTAEALACAEAGQAPLFLGDWGSFSINDVAAFLPQFFSGGPLDAARVPELSALLARAAGSGDADERRGLYAQAIRLITSQALFLPTHGYATTYCFNRALGFHAYPDELPRFHLAMWK